MHILQKFVPLKPKSKAEIKQVLILSQLPFANNNVHIILLSVVELCKSTGKKYWNNGVLDLNKITPIAILGLKR